MYNPFIILVVAHVGSYAEVQGLAAFLMTRTLPCRRDINIYVSYILQCNREDRQIQNIYPKILLNCSLSIMKVLKIY